MFVNSLYSNNPPKIFAKLNNFLATSHMCCIVPFHEQTENAKRK